MHIIRALFLAFCLLGVCLPAIAKADCLSSFLLLVQAGAANQNDAARQVRAQTGGRVLGVQTVSRDGQSIFLVKVLLPSGTVRVVEVTGN